MPVPTPALLMARLRSVPELSGTDRELVRQFLRDHSEAAFTTIVRRHAPMVLGVCRRVVGNLHDAEDALQATFVILARKAGSISNPESLASWLYGVAYRVARELRQMRDRQRQRDAQLVTDRSTDDRENQSLTEVAEIAAIVDEEISKLSEPARAVIVLCELEGRSRRDAAAALGIPEGTLSSRLATAKRTLASRLSRRGVTASTAILGTLLARNVGAKVSASTVASVIDGAIGSTASLSPQVVSLAEGMVKVMFATKLKSLSFTVGIVVLAIGGFSTVPGFAPDFAVAREASLAQRPVADTKPTTPVVAMQARVNDWPTPRGDAANTGVAHARLPASLELAWKRSTAEFMKGSATVANGIVFAATDEGHLHALDATTGEPKWKRKLARMNSSPVVRDGRVYIGDMNGKLYCLASKDGEMVWSAAIATDAITAAPTFHGSHVIVPSHDKTVTALTLDGKVAWRFTADDMIHGTPAVVGDRVYVVGCDSQLRTLDAKTGRALEQFDLGGQTGSAPAVVGDHLYVGTMSGHLHAIDLKTMKRVWRFAEEKQQGFLASPSVTDSLVVVGNTDGRIRAFDRTNGKVVWDFVTNDNQEGSPVVVDSRVICGNGMAVVVLDLKTGRLLQSFKIDGELLGTPAVVDGAVFVASDAGTVYKFGKKP